MIYDSQTSYSAFRKKKSKFKVREYFSLLAFRTSLDSLPMALSESCYLQLDNISFPLQVCHWGISVINVRGRSSSHRPKHPLHQTSQSATLVSPAALPLSFHYLSSAACLLSVDSALSVHPSQPYFTSVQRAAWLRHCFPMLPLSPCVSPWAEVELLLFLVPVGSVLCDSAVSCKQTGLIGHCYS